MAWGEKWGSPDVSDFCYLNDIVWEIYKVSPYNFPAWWLVMISAKLMGDLSGFKYVVCFNRNPPGIIIQFDLRIFLHIWWFNHQLVFFLLGEVWVPGYKVSQ